MHIDIGQGIMEYLYLYTYYLDLQVFRSDPRGGRYDPRRRQTSFLPNIKYYFNLALSIQLI